jgi:hypothetical protein
VTVDETNVGSILEPGQYGDSVLEHTLAFAQLLQNSWAGDEVEEVVMKCQKAEVEVDRKQSVGDAYDLLEDCVDADSSSCSGTETCAPSQDLVAYMEIHEQNLGPADAGIATDVEAVVVIVNYTSNLRNDVLGTVESRLGMVAKHNQAMVDLGIDMEDLVAAAAAAAAAAVVVAYVGDIVASVDLVALVFS